MRGIKGVRMSKAEVVVHSWSGERPASEEAIQDRLAAEGLRPYRWANAPGDVYAAHTHAYRKVLYVARGSITFGLPESGRQVALQAGDRLELPPAVVHDAVVGPDGVICLEAHDESVVLGTKRADLST
jgi:quercetin dioxygenase-like cupin family protein